MTKESVMAKSTNIIRGAAVSAMIALSSISIGAQAGDLNTQVQQNMLDALGKVFSAQVSMLSEEISNDISQTIDNGLVELGFEIAQKTKQVVTTTESSDK